MSIAFSAGLHIVYGPHPTVNFKYFTYPSPGKFNGQYKDLGKLKDSTLSYEGNNAWKLSCYWGDAGYYLLQSSNTSNSIAPYKYRILPTLIVRFLSKTFDIHVSFAFVVMNLFFAISTALLLTFYLSESFSMNHLLSLIGGILFLTSLPVTSTIAFPMVDITSFFFSLCVFISVKNKNTLLFIVSAFLGVLSKEILIISSLMWLLENFQIKDKLKLSFDLLISSLPLLTFAITRVLLGGHPLEVSYGFNFLSGQFPDYWKRMLSFSGVFSLFTKVFLSFSFLWLGIINIAKNEFLKRQSVIIILVIAASFMLSSSIARILGVLFPIVIPSFLLFFQEKQKISSA